MPRQPRPSNRTASPRAARPRGRSAYVGLGGNSTRAAPPAVASINLCADQLVLALADPEQILTVSWLSADPEESLFANAAARHPLNYGTAEELLRFHPDVVIAGAYTNSFTRALLIRLGYRVVELVPENTVAEIESNLRTVAERGGPSRARRAARRR